MSKQEPEVPLTIQKIRALPPGRSLTFYTGNYKDDLESCQASNQFGEAPKYARLLISIFTEVDELVKAKKAELSITQKKLKDGFSVFEYTLRRCAH